MRRALPHLDPLELLTLALAALTLIAAFLFAAL